MTQRNTNMSMPDKALTGKRLMKDPRYFNSMTFFVQHKKESGEHDHELVDLIKRHAGDVARDPKASNITHYLVSLPSSATSKAEVTVPRHYLGQPQPLEAKRWDIYDVLIHSLEDKRTKGDHIVPSKKVFAREWVRESIKAQQLLPAKDWQIIGVVKTVPKTPPPNKAAVLVLEPPALSRDKNATIAGSSLPSRPVIPKWRPEMPPFHSVPAKIIVLYTRGVADTRANMCTQTTHNRVPTSPKRDRLIAPPDHPIYINQEAQIHVRETQASRSLLSRLRPTSNDLDHNPASRPREEHSMPTPTSPAKSPVLLVAPKEPPSAIFSGPFGIPLSFHVVGSSVGRRELEILIENIGGGELLPLKAATFIVLATSSDDGQADHEDSRLAFAQVKDSSSRIVVGQKWIEECCNAGSLLDPHLYRSVCPQDDDERGYESEEDIDGYLQLAHGRATSAQPVDEERNCFSPSTATVRSTSSTSSFRTASTSPSEVTRSNHGCLQHEDDRNHKRLKTTHVASKDRRDYEYLAKNISAWLKTPLRDSQAKFLAHLQPLPQQGGGWLGLYMKYRSTLMADYPELGATKEGEKNEVE